MIHIISILKSIGISGIAMSCFSIRRMSAFRARITAFFTAFVFLTAALPAYAERLPDFLAKIQPSEIFPGADRYGKPEGKPMVARVYKGDEQLGLVYITTDAVNTRGYSSKPIDTLMALANDGTIAGAKLVDHHEPIMLIGIPQSRVDKFIDKYIGLNFIKNPPAPGVAPGDIISGATVTLMVVNDSIQRSYKVIANQYRLGSDKALQTASASDVREAAPASETRPRRMANPDKQDILSWDELLKQKAVGHLHITLDQINKLFEKGGKAGVADHAEQGDPDDTFIDLYVALVSQPSIGKSLLGEDGWAHLQKRLKPGQQAVLVAGEGRYSWKGSGYVRGGIFDRIEMIQGENSFRFTDAQHERVVELSAADAPRFKEVSWFTIPEGVAFDGAEPWRL
ncbi:FMN-binding protein [Neisseria gonorrhoeae]